MLVFDYPLKYFFTLRSWAFTSLMFHDFPIKHGDFPIKHGDFPIKHGVNIPEGKSFVQRKNHLKDPRDSTYKPLGASTFPSNISPYPKKSSTQWYHVVSLQAPEESYDFAIKNGRSPSPPCLPTAFTATRLQKSHASA